MKKDKKDELVLLMEEVAKDMATDIEALDGKPFNGNTMGEAFGNQAAAIVALTYAIKIILLEEENNETQTG